MIKKYRNCLRELEKSLTNPQCFKDLKNLKKLKEKAKSGDMESQNKLGKLYINGIITEYEYLQKMIEVLLLGQDGAKETQDYEKKERQDFEKGVELCEKLVCCHYYKINQLGFLLEHRYLDERKKDKFLQSSRCFKLIS